MRKALQQICHRIRSFSWKRPTQSNLAGESPTPTKPKPSTLDYENTLIELLDRVERGNTWRQLQKVLITDQIEKNKLARWLRGKGEEWLDQAEPDTQLGQGLQKLGERATGELGEVARQLGVRLGGDSVAEVNAPENLGSGEGSENAKFWCNRGVELYKQGDLLGSLDCFDLAIQLQPDYHKAWNIRGVVLTNLDKKKQLLLSIEL